MANLKVCDVCKAAGVMRQSTWRVGYKQPHMKLDVCDEHKGVSKDFKSLKDWDAYCFNLMCFESE